MNFSLFSDYPLDTLTTFGIGGKARYMIEAHDVDTMRQAFSFCQKEQLPFLVIGKGSNLLFRDEGFPGLVIVNKIAFCEREGEIVHVGAGYSFSLLGHQTAREGLTGLEFASGIPGSVGGAVFMNAGANGQETASTLLSVDFMSPDGLVTTYPAEALTFAYRTSPFQNQPGAVIAATFRLKKEEGARKRQLELIDYRTKTQPYKDKSAGCLFRNPPGAHAGALIEKSGLKGFSIGGAAVSDVHANFIINRDNASCHDVLRLVDHICSTVKQKTGYDLETEVRCLP